MVSLAETPLTGEPDAGDPPVRFGGRGGANPAIPTPIAAELRRRRVRCVQDLELLNPETGKTRSLEFH
jgi:hypothetical protein